MLNRDVNARFEDWLLSPTEGLDFEAKQWLDMSDKEAQGLVAKALIALENHGGGFLVIGYAEDDQKRLRPDPARPASLEQYSADAINAIIKRCAEPAFHVEVFIQKHRESGDEYPLMRATGRSKVPVRSCSATPNKSLQQNVYYIRRPGPNSDGPKTAAEWDQLMRRCVMNQREEIIAVLRAFSSPGGSVGDALPPTKIDLLDAFTEASKLAWSKLNASLDATHAARISKGYYCFSARVLGKSRELDAAAILAALEGARKYTGWPSFVVLHQPDTRPKLVGGAVEAWTAKCPYPGVSYADYWRITPSGEFFLLRGYDEDALESKIKAAPEPGTAFEPTLPVWRLAEFLLRLTEVADSMFEPGFEVAVECEWTGLKGRHTVSLNRRIFFDSVTCSDDVVRTRGTFTQAMLQDVLPDVVRKLTPPRHNSCRLHRTRPGGGDEGRECRDTDEHSRTGLWHACCRPRAPRRKMLRARLASGRTRSSGGSVSRCHSPLASGPGQLWRGSMPC